MKKITFLIVSLLYVSFIAAQSGDTINDAIAMDGSGIDLDLLDFNSATPSGLSPTCGSTEDVFYRHAVSSGDNKITIGMLSAGVSLLTSVEYQILLAPNGDTNNLQLVDCDSYAVLLVIGGSFELVIDNVNDTDVYYLRVYKTSGLGGVLTDLLNGTSITMMSEFDPALSTTDVEKVELKVVVKVNEIKLPNSDYNSYEIYGLDGKKIMSRANGQVVNSINISQLNKGLFVLRLSNGTNTYAHKFVKR
jgi:hypothetical protein